MHFGSRLKNGSTFVGGGQRHSFFGVLSLENNGGFASVRTKPTALGLRAGDIIVARVRGDGRAYVLNLSTKSRRTAFSYRAPLPTTKDEWTEAKVPLADFVPTAFGRRVEGMGQVEPDQVNGLGFMLSDKKPGRFQMQVAWVRVERAGEWAAVPSPSRDRPQKGGRSRTSPTSSRQRSGSPRCSRSMAWEPSSSADRQRRRAVPGGG